jgi:hypothetical protein
MINRFRELLPFGEVPIRLMIRGREGGGKPPTTSIDEGVGAAPPQPRRPAKAPPRGKAGGKPARPKRSEAKPHPKPAKRGPARGTRPHR